MANNDEHIPRDRIRYSVTSILQHAVLRNHVAV